MYRGFVTNVKRPIWQSIGTVAELGAQVWRWRARQQPRTSDDIPRLDRPAGWLPQVSAADIEAQRAELAELMEHWQRLTPTGDDVALAVDHRLLGSALARVHWELDVLRLWQRHPGFYVDQAVGCVFDELVKAPLTDEVVADVARLLAAVPQVLRDGRANLQGHAWSQFAAGTVAELAGIEDDLGAMCRELLTALAAQGLAEPPSLAAVAADAGAALGRFRDWLAERVEAMEPAQPVGADAFAWFLREVALLPQQPADLMALGSLEAERAAAWEAVARARTGPAGLDGPRSRFADPAEQAAAQRTAEHAVRGFYRSAALLDLPDDVAHYYTEAFPAYLVPIAWAGTADDLTSPARLGQQSRAYFPPPSEELPYFYAANAHDPRIGIVHEGAHAYQLAMAWAHPNPVRRHYYDSVANEGIAFYHEELMLSAGLFDDDALSRQVLFNMMRLRALRVVVDVGLAGGTLDIPAAGRLLAEKVPMDRATAEHEAAFFAATPGQAMTYQVGKSEVLRLLADAARSGGAQFSLRDFHTRLFTEGNVALSLQRWELLGDRSDVDALDAVRAAAGSAHPLRLG